MNKKYYFSTVKKNYKDARSHCKQLRGDLVTVENQIEDKFLLKKMKEKGRYYAYIGLTDQKVEGKFEWNINHNSKYTNWCSGGPFGGDCVQISRSSGCWFDYVCSSVEHYICEIP